MSEFINTIDLQGDPETLGNLVTNTQTTFNDDIIPVLGNHAFRSRTALTSVNLPEVTSIGDYAFSDDTSLVSVDLPNVESIGDYAFQYNTSLESITLPEATSLGRYAFRGDNILSNISIPKVTLIKNEAFMDTFSAGVVCAPSTTDFSISISEDNQGLSMGYGIAGFDFSQNITIPNKAFWNDLNFSTLILRSNTLCRLLNTNAFDITSLGYGYGYIYVPDDLVNTYKTASNWSNFASRIKPLSSYPLEFDGGTITDSWAEILANEENGTYSTKYSLRDTKFVNINGVSVKMEIVAFDADELSDNTGNAKITWLSKECVYKLPYNLTRTTEGGWAGSYIRSFLRNYMFPNIESTVKNNIKTVKKAYFCNGSTSMVDDTIWIPSRHEVGDNGETSGPIYKISATGALDRDLRKTIYPCGNAGGTAAWWLRSCYSDRFSNIVSSLGSVSNLPANNPNGYFPIGFCT